jgi:hypothetical protein
MDKNLADFIATSKNAAQDMTRAAGIAPFSASPYIGYGIFTITDILTYFVIALFFFLPFHKIGIDEDTSAAAKRTLDLMAKIKSSAVADWCRTIGKIATFGFVVQMWGMMSWACPQFADTFAAYADETNATVRVMFWAAFILYMLWVGAVGCHVRNIHNTSSFSRFLGYFWPIVQIVLSAGLFAVCVAAFAFTKNNTYGLFTVDFDDPVLAYNAAGIAFGVVGILGQITCSIIDMVMLAGIKNGVDGSKSTNV